MKLSLDATQRFKYEVCPDSGFLKAIGVCARSGIQEYFGYEIGLSGEDANKVFNVYRSEDEVVASLSSYNGAIVTDDHPDGLATVKDSKDLSKGNVSEAYGFTKDGLYYIVAKMTITDEGLIQKVLSGKKELSAGYTREIKQESGKFGDDSYEYIQTDIKTNHVAVVEEGRCGDTCKLNLDKKVVKMDGIKIQMDGKTVTMDTAEAVRYMGELKTQRDEAKAETEKVKEELDAVNGSTEELQAEMVSKIAELAELSEKIKSMISPEEAEDMAKESVEIEEDAKELGVELKEKSNDAKRKELLGAISNGKHSMDSLAGDSLKAVYSISVDNAKQAKKLQTDGYKGTSTKGATVPKTGNFANDLNSIAAAARAEKRGDK